MKRKFRGQIKKGIIAFASARIEGLYQTWLDNNDGKFVTIMEDSPITIDQYRFFHGAVVPYFGLQHFILEDGVWRRMGIYEAKGCLKLEFNPVYDTTLDGKKERTGGSLKLLNKSEMDDFMSKVHHYFKENEYEFPDSEDYNRWTESAPTIHETYTPLDWLKAISDKKLEDMQ